MQANGLSSPTLPVEILHMIISQLKPLHWQQPVNSRGLSGKEDLMACSAVSRIWHEVTRQYLFCDLVVSFFQGIPIGRAPLLRRRELRLSLLPTFPKLLAFLIEFPSVAQRIKRLRLHARHSFKLPDDSDRYPDTLRIQPTMLLSILRLLPQLRVVHLINVALAVPVNPGMELLTSLDRVQISYISQNDSWFIPDLEIIQLLGCFNDVKELHLSGCGKWSMDPIPDIQLRSAGQSQLQLRSLVIQRRLNGAALLRYLTKPWTSGIYRLILRKINLIEEVDFEPFADFLRAIGPQLQQLRMNLRHGHFRGKFISIFLPTPR